MERDAQRGEEVKWVELAQIIAIAIAIFGSLPVFAVIAGPVQSKFLSILVGFGGWTLWCSIIIYATRGWVRNGA
jgi:hypothetical protein